MKKLTAIFLFIISFISLYAQDYTKETMEEHNTRMSWWRDARFGLFIHWGLYAIPAGEWGGETNYAEWIRTQAEIPIEEYDKLVAQFNPVKFKANEWVSYAKEAGMKYIVITSKHHDGFCLFDSKYTDYDIMSTPFRRDVLKELLEACKKQGIKLCFYHSIMDWHHPDYLPRRDWEKDRTTEGADFDRYVAHMKDQLKELVTNYGDLGVLWFDGEWENTWSDERGKDLYNYVRSLKPDIIINNRVSSSRSGMEGFTTEGGFAGDFGTPEQQVPSTGLPGVDWESCITMNDHWGYNKNDNNWKSTKDILHMLADIASKGGNYLLNIGPTADGVFPPESIERLKGIGKWMKINSEAIYGTTASPFKKLEWGRCTQKKIGDGTWLYLHVFEWPDNGKLVVPGFYSEPQKVYLLADKDKAPLSFERDEDAIVISLPSKAPDEINTVIVLNINGKPDVNNPPEFESEQKIFIDKLDVNLKSDRTNVEIRYTTDGSKPSIESPLVVGPITLTSTSTLSARCFRNGKPVSETVQETFTKVKPEPAVKIENVKNGIRYKYFEGDWNVLPDFNSFTPVDEGFMQNITLTLSEDKQAQNKSANYFGFEYSGYIKVPTDGLYTFYTASDDGSKLYIGDELIVDNDGLHGIIEKSGVIALEEGYHPLRVVFFEKTGGEDLKIYLKGSGTKKELLPNSILFYEE